MLFYQNKYINKKNNNQGKRGWQEKMHFLPNSNYICIYTHMWRVNVLFCILCFCLPIHG